MQSLTGLSQTVRTDRSPPAASIEEPEGSPDDVPDRVRPEMHPHSSQEAVLPEELGRHEGEASVQKEKLQLLLTTRVTTL